MTTDTYPKALSMNLGQAVLTIVGKGAGMIEPNMATMLVYIFTDAEIDAPSLDHILRRAVSVSFNMLSVDTDTSTSDTCVALANGLAGPVDLIRDGGFAGRTTLLYVAAGEGFALGWGVET